MTEMLEIWCSGCREVKGEMEKDFATKHVGELGCCPVCETKWEWRDKVVH
jgi:hypothetical protein